MGFRVSEQNTTLSSRLIESEKSVLDEKSNITQVVNKTKSDVNATSKQNDLQKNSTTNSQQTTIKQIPFSHPVHLSIGTAAGAGIAYAVYNYREKNGKSGWLIPALMGVWGGVIANLTSNSTHHWLINKETLRPTNDDIVHNPIHKVVSLASSVGTGYLVHKYIAKKGNKSLVLPVIGGMVAGSVNGYLSSKAHLALRNN